MGARVCVGGTTVVYQQRPQPQTVVVRDRRSSHGMGNMATGIQLFLLTYNQRCSIALSTMMLNH